MMVLGSLKLFAFGAALALPAAFAAGAWIGNEEQPSGAPVIKVFLEPKAAPTASEGDLTMPQYDIGGGGDTHFIIDPDGNDDQSRNRHCDPSDDECDDEPVDPDYAVIKI